MTIILQITAELISAVADEGQRIRAEEQAKKAEAAAQAQQAIQQAAEPAAAPAAPAKPLTFEDVTPMTEAPKKGTWYWVIHPFNSRGVEAFAWGGDEYDLAALRHRMAYLEREHALIAAQYIFGLKGGEL